MISHGVQLSDERWLCDDNSSDDIDDDIDDQPWHYW